MYHLKIVPTACDPSTLLCQRVWQFCISILFSGRVAATAFQLSTAIQLTGNSTGREATHGCITVDTVLHHLSAELQIRRSQKYHLTTVLRMELTAK